MVRFVICVSLFLIITPKSVLSHYEDWTYELHDSATVIYENKETQIPCSDIPTLVADKAWDKTYIAIRDAGLFKDVTCKTYVRDLENTKIPADKPYFKSVIAFYWVRLGDKSQLQILLNAFDSDAKDVGDHVTVELFGFLPDWTEVGRRLVRHASYADGAGAEMLCSAILWRRHLYGEREFERNWFKVGREEDIEERTLRHFFNKCKQAN